MSGNIIVTLSVKPFGYFGGLPWIMFLILQFLKILQILKPMNYLNWSRILNKKVIHWFTEVLLAMYTSLYHKQYICFRYKSLSHPNYWTATSGRFYLTFCFFMAWQPLVGQGFLIVDASRSHSDTSHSVGLLWLARRQHHCLITHNTHTLPDVMEQHTKRTS